MPEIQLSAGTIDYEDAGGSGPVVVLLHGLAMDGSLWRRVVGELRADHRCLVPRARRCVCGSRSAVVASERGFMSAYRR